MNKSLSQRLIVHWTKKSKITRSKISEHESQKFGRKGFTPHHVNSMYMNSKMWLYYFQYIRRSVRYKYGAGFTLIELLVVLAISSLLVGVSITSYVSVNNRQGVEQEAQNFKQFFDEAKNNATSFVKPSSCVNATGGAVVMGYEVEVTTTAPGVPAALTMRGICGNLSPIPTPIASPVTIKTLDLSKYTVAGGTTCKKFFYGVLKNGYTCGIEGSNQPTETFTLSANGITKSFDIDRNGNMQVQ